MNWLEFIASTVESIAWPVVILVLIVLLRKPFAELVPFLERLKYKDFEIEFAERVQEIRSQLPAEPPTPATKSQPGPEPSTAAQRAKVSPRAAVAEAWREVESAAMSAARRLGGPRSKTLSYEAIRYLEQSDRLDRGTVSLLRDLRGLRNQVAHAPEFALSARSALEYEDAAARVAAHLESPVRPPSGGKKRD